MDAVTTHHFSGLGAPFVRSKGTVSGGVFNRHANLKYKYGDRHCWARGYYVDTVGRNKKQIQEYIKRQLETDQIADQMSLKEFVDPFTGSKNTKA